jgi:F-type H+-transporting ATPase subunit delta
MSIKKYVKALVETTTKEHLETIYNNLKVMEVISKNEKYKLIVLSPVLNSEQKVEFIKNLLDLKDEKIVNLLRLLSSNNRLMELPSFIALLKDIIADLTGDYTGYLYSKDSLNESKISEIESRLSDKFQKNIKLIQKTSQRDGIQVYVDSLNIEIAVYEDDIKAKLITDIIRAI